MGLVQGHTAHTNSQEAREMVAAALEWYRAVYEELLAVPVIPGTKSQKEKFAGADDTSTVEVSATFGPSVFHAKSETAIFPHLCVAFAVPPKVF